MIKFQSTPLREGRHDSFFRTSSFMSFNPRPCARGDKALDGHPMLKLLFQSTPLREGRLMLEMSPVLIVSFQSTPLREGRRETLASPREELDLFQSTPLREGRLRMPLRWDVLHGFNPRPCARGDGPDAQAVRCLDAVSIHAPARGATTCA